MVLGLVSSDSIPECPLQVGVEVHLDGPVADGLADLLPGGTGSAVEDEVHGLGSRAERLLDVILGILEDGGLELHVAGLVDAVHVAEGGRDREVGADLSQRGVGLGDFLGLRVELRLLDTGVIHPVLLAACHAEFDLEGHAHFGHPLEILGADLQILVQRLLGKIEHVRAVERPSCLGELLLAGREHPVHPREQFLGAVVGVENDRHAVGLRGGVHIVGPGDASDDGAGLTLLRDPLSDEEVGSTVGKLNHHRRVHLAGGGQSRVDGTGADAVDRRKRELARLGVIEKFLHLFAEEDACTKLFAHVMIVWVVVTWIRRMVFTLLRGESQEGSRYRSNLGRRILRQFSRQRGPARIPCRRPVRTASRFPYPRRPGSQQGPPRVAGPPRDTGRVTACRSHNPPR